MSLKRLLTFYGLLITWLSSLQVVFRITSLGCCAAGSIPEILVWRSLLDWCVSLISKKHFPFCAQYSVSIPVIIIIIITLFIWTHKSMFAVLLFSRKGKKPNGWWLWEWGGDSGRYHMDLCSLGMWIILAKIFVNISHHFSHGRRVKASWINMGRSHLPGTRVLGGPDFCITPLL